LKESGEIAGIGAGVNDMGTRPRFLDESISTSSWWRRATLIDQRTRRRVSAVGQECGVIIGLPVPESWPLPSPAKYNYENAAGDIALGRQDRAVCASRHAYRGRAAIVLAIRFTPA
jgi:hypothetical protein